MTFRRFSRHAPLPALLFIAGCAPTQSVFRYEAEPAGASAVWPAPPEVPRFRYVGELVGEQNFHAPEQGAGGAAKGFLRWLVGLTSGKHVPVVLQRPQGVMVDEPGRIYITDVSRRAVYVFDQAAGALRVWDSAGENTAFITPVGIAAGADGEILVVDADLKRVVRLDQQGRPLGAFGQGQLMRPTGIARDTARGLIYVADTHGHDIKVFNDAGDLVDTIGKRGEAAGEFNSPTYLVFDHDKLYVSDTLNARVQVLSPQGGVLEVFGRRGLYVGDMVRPKGIAVDDLGNIYVVESYYDYLLVFNAKGELLLPIGGTGGSPGEFYLPAGVWAERDGHVYVVDSFNGRVVVLAFLGEGA